jgi:hypothetical protein
MGRWRAHEIYWRVPCVQFVEKYLQMFVTVLLFLVCLMESATSGKILFHGFISGVVLDISVKYTPLKTVQIQ